MAHRNNSRRRGNSVACGAKRTFSELRLPNRIYEDAAALEKAGVAAVYTPKDFELNRIMADVVRIVERANGASNV